MHGGCRLRVTWSNLDLRAHPGCQGAPFGPPGLARRDREAP